SAGHHIRGRRPGHDKLPWARHKGGAMAEISRRRFVGTLAMGGGWLAGGQLLGRAASAQGVTDPILAGRPLVRYPEKTDLLLLTARPPQLETPMRYFDRAITPNEAFFVRYHIFPIATSVDLATWRLRVTGVVDRPLELSMDDLRGKFPKVAVTAVNQCSGN